MTYRSSDSTDKPIVPHTLLLADDSVTIQRVIELTFADEDVHVVAVSDGDQAIARIEADAARHRARRRRHARARTATRSRSTSSSRPRLAHIPVLLLTGAFEPVDQARAAEAGCDGVLAKPFEPQLVIGRVKELLATQAARTASAVDDRAAPRPSRRWTLAGRRAERRAQAAAPRRSRRRSTLDDYFDRLDAAFANLRRAPRRRAPEPPAADVDWFDAQAASRVAG